MVSATRHKLLGAACIAVWCGLIVVGLWPFNFSPANQVQWMGSRSGVHFEPEGQIYSEVALPSFRPDGSFSIELRLQPSVVCGCLSTIVSIYDPDRTENFRIEQSIGDLVVRGRFRDSNNHVRFRPLYVPDIFHKDQERYITLTSGPEGTSIYVDSVRARFLEDRLEAENLSGRILVGHSASANKPWRGSFQGLAIYNRALTKEEVVQHLSAWNEGRTAELAAGQGIAAFYPIDERQGDVIHSRASSGPNLHIPPKFYLLHLTVLEVPRKFNRSDIKDASINIFGFVPFGFLVAMYLRQEAQVGKSRQIILSLVLGGITSLLIEVTQVYLPSRDSSSLDLVNNILGTGLGCLLLNLAGKYIPEASAFRS